MTGVGTALRRGHDVSCPYKEKQEPGFPVKATGTPRRAASRAVGTGRGEGPARESAGGHFLCDPDLVGVNGEFRLLLERRSRAEWRRRRPFGRVGLRQGASAASRHRGPPTILEAARDPLKRRRACASRRRPADWKRTL